MRNAGTKLKKQLFGIDASEVTFARRGFLATDPAVVAALEKVGVAFVAGYHAALSQSEPRALAEALSEVNAAHRGFAYEGAGMALTLLDRLTPWKRSRFGEFLQGPGEPHTYMVIIGAGWAFARLGSPIARLAAKIDPLLGWLAFDGYGFHEGYFHSERSVTQQCRPRGMQGYAGRVFDAGLGRSLWFVCGGQAAVLATTIAAFSSERQADLWAGAGLACAYAGGVDDSMVKDMRQRAGDYRGYLAQGAAFAAKARQRAGLPSAPSAFAVQELTGMSFEQAVRICDEAESECRSTSIELAQEPTFEVWRSRIRQRFEQAFAGVEHA
ncbi:MAG: DUF1702 family protein [Myxococcota bacterium]|nr:DUF1702 family protein [Myxococcota bacterium]